MDYAVGIDGGATKTVAVLLDKLGNIQNRIEVGPSAYQNLGLARSVEIIMSSIVEVTSFLKEGRVLQICIGLAGVDSREDKILVRDNLYQLLSTDGVLPGIANPANITVEHDTLIALTGGIGVNTGIVVIAGTGSIAFGVNKLGKAKRAGGWGYFLGDDGSAFQIAQKGLRAVLRSHDGRLMRTSLTEKFKEALQIKQIEDLMHVIYQTRLEVNEIAQLAKLVDEAAFEGDIVAQNILDEAVEEFRISTTVVIDNLFSDKDEFDIVTSGSVWQSKYGLRDRYIQAMSGRVKKDRIIFPRYEPAYGAGLIALKSLMEKSNE
jgi:N-acetylglucosamine kinase